MHATQRCARVLMLVGWMALITYWSSQGNLPIDQPVINDNLHGFQHRIAHLLAFGLLGVLARWSFNGFPRATVWAVVLASAFGASDEWHQQFTPSRRAALDDWALDTASFGSPSRRARATHRRRPGHPPSPAAQRPLGNPAHRRQPRHPARPRHPQRRPPVPLHHRRLTHRLVTAVTPHRRMPLPHSPTVMRCGWNRNSQTRTEPLYNERACRSRRHTPRHEPTSPA